jgi:hypothetical protein
MRPIKLIPVLAAATTLLALAAAGASGRPAGQVGPHHTAAVGGCRFTVEAPDVITFGESVTVFGHLSCPTAGDAASKEVKILQRPLPPLQAASLAGAASTDASGAFKFEASPSVDTTYLAVAPNARSAHVTVKVSPAVSLEGPKATELFTGRGPILGATRPAAGRLAYKVTFTGTVKPAHVGEVVALQRSSATTNEEWRRIALGVVSSVTGNEGRYTIKHTFAVPGDANIRVVAHPGPGNSPGASTSLSYVISQAQNPNLTIEAAAGADPINAGQSVTIGGVAKGAAGQQVTLWSHTKNIKFAPIASTNAGAGGAYKFVQAPLRNTFYRVSDAATKSAVLFEGVKFVLTPASAPGTTALQDSALSFTGKVTPVRAGHVIYLERQNASGVGYHVVEVSTVSAVGTYSVSRAFLDTGVAKLRVKIPGDPENQGASTPLVSVSITPAPAGSLVPLVPPREPSEGQL